MSIEHTAPKETSAPGITVGQAEAFLAERFEQGDTEVTALRQGGWSNAYAFRFNNGDHVIRFSAYGDDFDKDRFAMRWTSPSLPVPTVSEVGEAFGGYYAISERVAGIALDDLAGAGLQVVLPSLLAMLDALRTTDLSGTSGFGGWDEAGVATCDTWQEFLLGVADDTPEQRNHGWRAQLAQSPSGIGRFDEAYGHFVDLARQMPSGRHLIHSDLLNYNMLVEGASISGVLDWGCGMFGDFLFDVAWFIHYWPWYPAWAKIDFVDEVRRRYRKIGLKVPDFDDRIRCYRIWIGLGDQAYNTYMRRWDLVEVAAAQTLTLAQGEH